MAARFPVVYLPVEFRSREFDAKALLAATLVARGYVVILGQQWMLYDNLATLPPGAVLFKSFNSIHHPAMQIARRAGHLVAILEEELLAHIEAKTIGNFCARGVFDIPHLVLANGEFERGVLHELSGGQLPIEVTGNARVDVLKPGFRGFFRREIEAIRARHGEFVLVNTNFGIINTAWQSIEQVTDIHVRAGFVRPDDPASMRAWQDQIDFEVRNKAAVLAAIRGLCARRPGQKVVVRPHPGEALERWHGVFADTPGVAVVREGNHVPWTLASRALLHTSCTTGFEAQAAGTMAFSIVPEPNWLSESMISNHLNAVYRDPAALVDALAGWLDGGAAPAAPRLADPVKYVANYGEASGVGRIADVLTRELPLSNALTGLPPLRQGPRDPRLQAKFTVSPQECKDVLERVVAAALPGLGFNLHQLGDSLFLLRP